MDTHPSRFHLKYSITNYEKKRVLVLEPIGEDWDIDINDMIVIEMSFPVVEQLTYGFGITFSDKAINIWHNSGKIEGVYINKKKINAFVDMPLDLQALEPLK